MKGVFIIHPVGQMYAPSSPLKEVVKPVNAVAYHKMKLLMLIMPVILLGVGLIAFCLLYILCKQRK